MKSVTRAFAIILPSFLVATSLAMPVAAQDKPKPAAAKADEKKAAPAADKVDKGAVPEGTTKVIVDNDKVRVTEVTFKPGQGGKAQERPPRVTRALSGGTMERTYPDGKTEKVEWKTGQVRYFGKENFGNRNVGKTDVVFYIVTPK